MATTPEPIKGVPRIEGNPAPTVRADHNALADWVLTNVDLSVANEAALPKTGNWQGRRATTQDNQSQWVYASTAVGWKRVNGNHRLGPYGSPWAPSGNAFPIIRFGVTSGDTSPQGVLQHFFPEPFPTFCSMPVLSLNDNSGMAPGSPPVIVQGSVDRNGFQTFWAGRASSPVGVPYIAFGA